jgi:Type IV secretion system pilin
MKRIVLGLMFLGGLMIIFSADSALAFNPFDDVKCEGTNQESTICNTANNDPVSGSNGLLAKITNIVSYVAGGAAIILLLVGSIRYITSGGDSGNVKKAKDTVFYALIGLAVIVVARSLILFVLSKL